MGFLNPKKKINAVRRMNQLVIQLKSQLCRFGEKVVCPKFCVKCNEETISNTMSYAIKSIRGLIDCMLVIV